MMRSLAEFIMKGRLHAALLALLGIPLFSTATIGLVTLRLGQQQGALILFVALIPTLIGVVMGKIPELLLWLSLISTFSVFIYSILLRISMSWVFTLIGSCVLMAIVLPLVAWQFEGLRESFSRIMMAPESLVDQNGLANEKPVVLQSVTWVSGIVALITMVNGFTSIVLARWWQSLLYNPGGFGNEFRAMRFEPLPAIVLTILSVLCLVVGADYSFWAVALCSPLVIAAIALVHFFIKLKGFGVLWVCVFYFLVVRFFMPIIAILALLGLLDAIFNFRKRLE